MNPASPYGDADLTVRDRLNQITQQKAALQQLVLQSDAFLKTLPDADWITYADRFKTFGEVPTLRWILSKHGQK